MAEVKSRKNVTTGLNCYVVQHAYVPDGSENDEVKFIGVFSSREQARKAVKKLKTKPGFRRFGRFHIDKYSIDAIHWSTGFVREYY
jgi:hypothetical protein